MNTALQTKTNNAQLFRSTASTIANRLLVDWVGPERAAEATGRITTALAACAASAKKQEDFYACTQQSVATCVATAALTGIMPGMGSAALAYLIPQRPRKDDPIELNYRLSHRGLNALALRCGQTMIAVPVGYGDRIEVDESMGINCSHLDIDNPPTTFDEMRGIVLVVKNIESGVVIHRGWMPKKLIEQRRDGSTAYRFALQNKWAQDSDPWHKWPVEQSMKTAMHYAVSRGWCTIDDTEAVRALSNETVIEAKTYKRIETNHDDEPQQSLAEQLENKVRGNGKKKPKAKPEDAEEVATTPEQSAPQESADLLSQFAAELAKCKNINATQALLKTWSSKTTDEELFMSMTDAAELHEKIVSRHWESTPRVQKVAED